MSSRLNYMPQLDAMRAIAVLMVLACHWIGGIWYFGGGAGVLLFYVLSGFLICRILLVAKYSGPNVSKLGIIKNFIGRRSLRIFPIYYLFIFFFFIVGDPYMRSHFVWYATYCSNIYFFKINSIDTTMYGHTWSLAVEEQFYLVWPWLILFIPIRHELKLIVAMILSAITCRYLLDSNGYYGLTLTPSNFDSFGIGALLAHLKLNQGSNEKILKLYSFVERSSNIFVMISILAISLFLFWWNPTVILKTTSNLLFQLTFSIFSMLFICKTADGIKGIGSYFFNNKVVLYIGKISYGIYLYHKVIPWAFSYMLAKFGYTYNERGILQYCLQLLTVTIIASISWRLIEAPINKLKRKFEYT